MNTYGKAVGRSGAECRCSSSSAREIAALLHLLACFCKLRFYLRELRRTRVKLFILVANRLRLSCVGFIRPSQPFGNVRELSEASLNSVLRIMCRRELSFQLFDTPF